MGSFADGESGCAVVLGLGADVCAVVAPAEVLSQREGFVYIALLMLEWIILAAAY